LSYERTRPAFTTTTPAPTSTTSSSFVVFQIGEDVLIESVTDHHDHANYHHTEKSKHHSESPPSSFTYQSRDPHHLKGNRVRLKQLPVKPHFLHPTQYSDVSTTTTHENLHHVRTYFYD